MRGRNAQSDTNEIKEGVRGVRGLDRLEESLSATRAMMNERGWATHRAQENHRQRSQVVDLANFLGL